MANVSKAEKMAREQAERELAFAKLKANWPKMLLDLAVAYANIPEFSVKCNNEDYVFTPSEDVVGYEIKFVIPFEPSLSIWEHEYNLNQAKKAVEDYHAKIAEERRLREVRRQALDKLNDEEKKVLGLR